MRTKKYEGRNLFDFQNDIENESIGFHLSTKKRKIQVNQSTTLRLNKVSVFSKKERELFHHIAEHAKSF